MKKAVFPGSFDPFTIGHESIVRRALSLFDEIIISIGYNVNKKGYFSLEDRKRWIASVFHDEPRVKVDHFEGLTIEYCKGTGANYLLRGLRTAADFEYERAIAQVNKAMYEGIETVFLLTMPEHTPVNSTIVRDIIRNGGDASKFLPKGMNIHDRAK
ncbi:MAG: pantetheine-phosphate adenylyltransferase [Bacteroidales bacterium]|nr:pantetheine-phosphate adenylyltransferase [Bacteroidales bacterium]MBS3776009.1 pantetheine-phosphate adenylyltransferase [Bacteroidales bacterium]